MENQGKRSNQNLTFGWLEKKSYEKEHLTSRGKCQFESSYLKENILTFMDSQEKLFNNWTTYRLLWKELFNSDGKIVFGRQNITGLIAARELALEFPDVREKI